MPISIKKVQPKINEFTMLFELTINWPSNKLGYVDFNYSVLKKNSMYMENYIENVDFDIKWIIKFF